VAQNGGGERYRRRRFFPHIRTNPLLEEQGGKGEAMDAATAWR
jgi:hypothetical protein